MYRVIDKAETLPDHSKDRARSDFEPRLRGFWKLADDERMAAEYRASENLRRLQSASAETLRRVFTQYRHFTIYYIADLALLVSRLPFGPLRSALGLFLSDELGSGDPALAHPRLYDDFLRSIGVDEAEFARPIAENERLLEDIQARVGQGSIASAVGLRGMGGECLCQIYLSAMYENFRANPFIERLGGQVAWKFWDIHTGPEDIHHREMTRAAINGFLLENPSALADLAAGYLVSKKAWDRFWENIFAQARREVVLQ